MKTRQCVDKSQLNYAIVKKDNTFSIAILFLLQMMAQQNTTFHAVPQRAQHSHAA